MDFTGTGQIFTNATVRTQYVDNLFTSRGVVLSNGTVTNVNIVDNLGTTTYQTDAENSTATTFINNFINSYVLNPSVTHNAIAFSTVFYWIPSRGTINFGFVVSSQGVTKLYYISVVVGTT